MKIALYQMKMSQNMQDNLQKSLNAIEEAAAQSADLILFPEIQCCPFFPQYEKLNVLKYVMPIDHPYIQHIQAACKVNQIMAAPNFYLLENGDTYDATVLIDCDGMILGIQKMVHIAQAKSFYEQDYYTPSNDGFHVFETRFGNIGTVVCFDRHYPESIRTEVLMGADLILIPTANTIEEPSEMFEWELRVQAFQNSVAIAMCNRVGTEDKMQFSGESLVVDPNGSVLCKADTSEQILFVDVDLSRVRPCREAKNYTELRRVELYK